MLKSTKSPVWIPLFTIFLCCFGCQKQAQPPQNKTAFSGVSMTMAYKVTLGHPLTPRELSKVKQAVSETFNDVNNLYNKYNPDSEISRFNRSKAGVPFRLSPQLQSLFVQTDKIVKLSGGLFDPTIEPLQALWREKLESGKEPTQSEIERIIPAIGWNKIHLKNDIAVKNHDLTSVDFGGIAKGLCIDLIIEKLQSMGYKNLFVEWGGEIRTTGNHPDHRPWNVAIRNVENADSTEAHSPATVVESTNCAIATSGDYHQFWKVTDDKGNLHTYFHIIHPKTLKPLEVMPDNVASVTVKAPCCCLADALATTVMLFGSYQESVSWAVDIEKSVDDTTFWIMTRKKGSDCTGSAQINPTFR